MWAARRSWDLRDVSSWLKAGVAEETRTRGIGTTALAEIVLGSMAVTIYSAVLHIATVYSSVRITSTSEPGRLYPEVSLEFTTRQRSSVEDGRPRQQHS